jgi:hypothetical protein
MTGDCEEEAFTGSLLLSETTILAAGGNIWASHRDTWLEDSLKSTIGVAKQASRGAPEQRKTLKRFEETDIILKQLLT